jgi:molecular chaperone DnaK
MMANSPVCVGIDLGTTNSVVAYFDGQQARVLGAKENGGLVPSVFGWQKPISREKDGSYLVGRPALRNWKNAPDNTVVCVKRLMGRFISEPGVEETKARFPYQITEGEKKQVAVRVGDGTFTPTDVSAQYLKYLKNRAEAELGRPVDSAVITVPAHFEERQRAATRKAGELAGLRVKKIIDEPSAAAIGFRINSGNERQTLMVFDLGGGTFDISIMHVTEHRKSGDSVFNVIEIDGDTWLGGTDFDNRILDHVVENFEREHGVDPRQDREFMALVRHEVEERKIKLSSSDSAKLVVPAAYRDDNRVIGLSMELTRDSYEKLVAPDVERAIDSVKRALKSRSFTGDDLSAVLLVGGSSQTPLVRQRLAEIVGEDKLHTNVNPMTVVAEGAAILAASLKGIECPNEECGEHREITNTSTGETISVFVHHVNDDSRTECEKCGTSLAAGRAATQGIQVKEPTPCSLGILAAEGAEGQSYVCLIRKGTHYPLVEPVKQSFKPFALATDRILIPVFEAVDNQGDKRKQQGVLSYDFSDTITASDVLELGFNLDRNRVVTVEISVVDSDMAPVIHQLELAEPPASTSGSSQRSTPDDELDCYIRHARQLLDRYGNYLEPRGFQRDKVQDDLKRAAKELDAIERGQHDERATQRVVNVLIQDLMESGIGAKLYHADLTVDRADLTLQNDIRAAQAKLKDAFDAKDPQEIKLADDRLAVLVARVRTTNSEGTSAEENEFDPQVLLTRI